jgi:hypothetical protein
VDSLVRAYYLLVCQGSSADEGLKKKKMIFLQKCFSQPSPFFETKVDVGNLRMPKTEQTFAKVEMLN